MYKSNGSSQEENLKIDFLFNDIEDYCINPLSSEGFVLMRPILHKIRTSLGIK